MPQNNNNQKVPSAVFRVAKLPVVRSACSTLSVLYKETKCSNSSLKSLCEALEDRVTALSTAAYTKVSPVIVKLEPQISIANGFACKGLDWLETSFPVLLSPTKEVVTTAKNKINEIQDVVSIAANGTIGCVQHTVTWVRSRMPQADGVNQSLVDRAISVATVGLDSALTLSEALIDHVLPPTDEDSENQALLEGFEAASHGRGYPVRMINLTTKLCRRTYHTVGSKIPSVQVCCEGDFNQIYCAGSGPSDQLLDPSLEPSRTASVFAASGGFCVFLHHPDVQLELSITAGTVTRSPLPPQCCWSFSPQRGAGSPRG